MANNLKEREAFEAWAGDQGYPLKRLETSDGYLDLRTQGSFEAWEASAAIRLNAHPVDAQAQSCVPAGVVQLDRKLAENCLAGMKYAAHWERDCDGRPPSQVCCFEIRDLERALAASPQPQPVQPSTNHLKEIYAYLCSTSPKGYADEAFRNVPDSLLPDSVRNRLAEQGPSLGQNARAIPEHAGSPKSVDGRDGQSVADPGVQAKPEQAAQPACTCLTGGLGPHYCERCSP